MSFWDWFKGTVPEPPVKPRRINDLTIEDRHKLHRLFKEIQEIAEEGYHQTFLWSDLKEEYNYSLSEIKETVFHINNRNREIYQIMTDFEERETLIEECLDES